jgi:hypothetical protein
MKITELYEKYVVIKLSDGSTVKPRQLTERERQIYDLAEELNVPPFIRSNGRRSCFSFDVHPLIKEQINEQQQCNKSRERGKADREDLI